MPTLDPNSWSRFDRDALDRHITGNWGEDAFLGDIDDTAPLELEPPMRLVYIRECAEESIPWYIYDAHTQEFITACGTQHGAVEYCTSEGWDVRDGPVAEEGDDEVVNGDDIDDGWDWWDREVE